MSQSLSGFRDELNGQGQDGHHDVRILLSIQQSAKKVNLLGWLDAMPLLRRVRLRGGSERRKLRSTASLLRVGAYGGLPVATLR